MDITVTAADGHNFSAYVNGPKDAKYGVVVLPEIFGVNSNIRSMADKFVDQSYRIISPSLFDRKAETGLQLAYSSEDIQHGLGLKRAVTDDMALLDIAAAAQILANQEKIFITGYCWGGYLSWRAACTQDAFSAASCWHGGGIVKHCSDHAIMPVQMHFGGIDKSIPMSDVDIIRHAQPDVEIHVYPLADHAFGREGSASYHADSANLAWQRTFEFFNKNK